MIVSTGRYIQVLIVGILLAAISAVSMAAQEAPKRVLVVQSQPSGDLFHSAIVSHLVGELPRQTPRVQVFVEALDASRLSLWRTPAFRHYLELKYGNGRFDVVVTVGSPAANAMRNAGAGYVSVAPWVVVNAGPSELEQLRKLPNVIPIGNVGAEFVHNMALITGLVPDIQHLRVVGRAATPQIQADIQEAIANVRQHYVSVERIDDARDTVIAGSLRQAPAHTAVFLAGWLEDASGQPLQGRELLEALPQRVSQPVFTAWDFVLGEGIVGGKLIATRDLGKRAGEVVAGLLRGSSVADFAHLEPVTNHYIFDYRALQRHGIPESRLPVGSEIRYQPLSLAQSNPVEFFSGLALIAFLAFALATTVIVMRVRRRSAEESAVNERHFRMLFEANPMGLLVFDSERMEILATNRRVEEILGPNSAVNGAPISALDFIPSADLDSFENDVRLNREQARRDIAERQLIRSNGDPVICEMLTHAIDYFGKPARLVMINDITQRVEAENRIADQNEFLNTLLNTIPQPVFWKGTDGRYLGGNNALTQVFGRPLPEIVGHTLAELTDGADFDRYVAADAELIANPGTQRFEDKMVFADAQLHDVLINKATYRHLGSQVIGLAGTITDISHIKRIEAQLRESNAALEQKVAARTAELARANEELHLAMQQLVQREKLAALGTLVAGVAHELNTPLGNTLTVVTTLSDRLRQFHGDFTQGTLRRSGLVQFLDDSIQACAMVERNTQRAAELVASFKLVAVDQASSRRRIFDLRTLVKETLLAVAHVHKGLAVGVETDIPPDLMLDSYPGALEQVLTNLILNAVAHGLTGQAPLRVRVRARADSDTNSVTLELDDNGAGMDAETLHRAFDPFFTTRMGQGGSGLGLYIVYNLVHGILGGTVELDSAPGAGARFTIRIPTHCPDRDT